MHSPPLPLPILANSAFAIESTEEGIRLHFSR